MNIGWFMKALGQYADFHSRARRREFWWFVLTAYLVMVAALSFTLVTLSTAVDGATLVVGDIRPAGWFMLILTVVLGLALVIPYWATTVRRLHDVERSGWWAIFLLFLPIVIWLIACIDGTPGNNRYGPDPKELERGEQA